MISLEKALEIHSILIEQFGGGNGLRDSELLESALGKPYQSFDNQELYQTPIEKAAAIMESIVKNHPFVDGNKRTGYVLGRLLLMNSGMDIHASEDEKYEFVIKISEGRIDYDEIKGWLNEKSC
ncbi:type II toxin-antitoxin system death-on-curing family toxin [Reichenbachiella sp.]|uniref:type II toxin-antitoxin system death-on-curing family toxin n=1 Tax=Reichenbachiella sp. TaxID=2184521 RepID=UPI003B5B7408